MPNIYQPALTDVFPIASFGSPVNMTMQSIIDTAPVNCNVILLFGNGSYFQVNFLNFQVSPQFYVGDYYYPQYPDYLSLYFGNNIDNTNKSVINYVQRNGDWYSQTSAIYTPFPKDINGENKLVYARPDSNVTQSIIYINFDTQIIINGEVPIQYTWSSVPAISGKNGILSLPVLIDTDGNPVSNGSASDFSTLPDSVKVRTLADLAVQ